jgi:hypothetical protein
MNLPSAIQVFVPVLNDAADGIAGRIKLHVENLKKHAGKRTGISCNGYEWRRVIAAD